MTECAFCGKPAPAHVNTCDWECSVGLAKRNGGRVHCPNGLPIASIRADNSMWEHEHGDHVDYKFPVDVEFVGDLDSHRDDEYFTALYGKPLNDEETRDALGQTHALIYTDGAIALTLYECCYCVFILDSGHCKDTGTLWKRGDWKLTDESLEKTRKVTQ